MNILTVDNIKKSYQERALFRGASFFLEEQEKVGIVGINGTGKSTLLKMLAGFEELDDGKIVFANHVVTQYLPQIPVFSPKQTVLQGAVGENIEESQRWSYESTAKAMLLELNILDFDAPCEGLSGGQKKKLALVRVLLKESDILLLDEPTNHLDHETIEWLEEKLKMYKGAIVMVTHDRYFLDSITTRIVEIDKGNIYSYHANYSGFLELKSGREEIEDAMERKRRSLLRVELEWLKRGARARSTKQKAHIDRIENLVNTSGPVRDKKVELDSLSTRLGRTTVEIRDLSKGYENHQLFRGFSYTFLKNDRIGFIGKNGCGKTTLLKIIAGICAPDEGNIFVGTTVKIGYFTQEISFLDESMRVIDYVKEGAEFIQTTEGSVSASKMLERFLFTSDMQYNMIGKLSGGEKRRLYLLRILMEAPNVLLLDEPTNDLDITTLTVLEDYLDRFQGIVIVISHDRYFLDRVVNRIFAFEDGKLQQYEGGYTDYLLKRKEKLQISQTKESREKEIIKQDRNSWKMNQVKKRKLSYEEQKDYECIEGEIERLEKNRDELEKEMQECASDFIKLNELNEKKEEVEKKLDEKMLRWMYLEDLLDKISKQ